jgi:hypothetical protein
VTCRLDLNPSVLTPSDTPQEVKITIRLPRGIRDGVFDLTLENQLDRSMRKRYVLPFGVPGRRR